MSKAGLRQRPRGKEKGTNEVSKDDEDEKKWPYYANGQLDPYAKTIGAAVVIVMTMLITYFRYQQYLRDIIITPIDSQFIIPANGSLPAVNPERFWGTYR